MNLLEANPQYAHVQFPDRREDTVSIKHLAPLGDKKVSVESDQSSPADIPQIVVDSPPSIPVDIPQIEVGTQVRNTENILNGDHQPPPPLRRSERQRKAPDRLVYVQLILRLWTGKSIGEIV